MRLLLGTPHQTGRWTLPPPSGLLVGCPAAGMLPNHSCRRGKWLSGWYPAGKQVTLQLVALQGLVYENCRTGGKEEFHADDER
jgi:hypothetical protein